MKSRIELAIGFAVVRNEKTIQIENPLGLKFTWHAPQKSLITTYQKMAIAFAKALADAYYSISAPEGFQLRTVEERKARESGFHAPRRQSSAARATDSRIGKAQWLMHPVGDWTAIFTPVETTHEKPHAN